MGPVRVHVAPRDRPPFEVEAVVIEDDTYSVLSSDPGFREPTEHPIRIWTEVHEMEPAQPGSVSVRPGRPHRFLAVIHDLSQDPTWTEAWISAALDEAFRHAEDLGVQSLGLPVLGAVHGRLPPESFVELLRQALEGRPPTTLRQIWLIASPPAAEALERLL